MMSTGPSARHDRPAVDASLLVARVTVGVIFAAHGSQKLFGAFAGPGLAAIVDMLGPIGYLVTIGEFFGGLGLIAGFLCRFSAASLIVIRSAPSSRYTVRKASFCRTVDLNTTWSLSVCSQPS